MPRTNATAVKAILLRDYDSKNEPSLDPFIEIASAMVDDLVDTGSEATDTRLELIERWLAAHYYVMSDLVYVSKSTDGVSGSFGSVPFPKGSGAFDLSRYGRMALSIDSTGKLRQSGASSSASGVALVTEL